MNRMYKEGELSFSIVMIILYYVVSLILRTSFGIDSIITLIGYLALLFLLFNFIKKNKLNKYYWLNKTKKSRKYLYFIPLFIVCFYNLYNGKIFNNYNMFIYILNMIVCASIEIIIFYGFLYKSLLKKKIKASILIVSIIFSIRQLFGILNGIDPVYSILNLMCMGVIGWMFACVINKSKSIIPCIISNILLCCFSIYIHSSYNIAIASTILVIIISISYCIYLEKKC